MLAVVAVVEDLVVARVEQAVTEVVEQGAAELRQGKLAVPVRRIEVEVEVVPEIAVPVEPADLVLLY